MNSISKIIVEINGKPLKDFNSVSINQDMYGIDGFEIICRFESIEKVDEFIVEKSKDFLGMPIVIQTKTKVNDKENDALFFKGYITEVQGRRSGMSDSDQITISGGSAEILLNRKPTNRAFLNKTLNDIIKEVLKPYPIKSKVKCRETRQFEYIVQYEESDLEFLQRLSIRYGEWFFFNGSEIIFGENPLVETGLTLGFDLEDLSYDLRVTPVKFKSLTVDPLENKTHRYKSGSNKVSPNLNIYGKHAYKQSNQFYPEEGNYSYQHLNVKETDYKSALERVSELDEQKDAINLADISGTSTNSSLAPGKFTGLSSGWGKYLVTSVQHNFDNLLTYQNSFTAIMAESTMPEYTDPNYIRESATQVAIVKDNRDPEKLGRLKVNFCWMEKNQTTPWIRMASPYVGANWGFYFVPPKNSAVFINFEAGDVERPFCCGAYFDKRTTPDQAWTGNYREQDAKMQVIRTSAGHTIEFEDVSSSSGKIKIYNANGENSITLDNENGALTIHADGDLKLNATNIEINAEEKFFINSGDSVDIHADNESILRSSGGKVVLDSATEIKIESMNIEINGNTSLKANGGTSTEVSSSGITTVKGSVVQIN